MWRTSVTRSALWTKSPRGSLRNREVHWREVFIENNGLKFFWWLFKTDQKLSFSCWVKLKKELQLCIWKQFWIKCSQCFQFHFLTFYPSTSFPVRNSIPSFPFVYRNDDILSSSNFSSGSAPLKFISVHQRYFNLRKHPFTPYTDLNLVLLLYFPLVHVAPDSVSNYPSLAYF